MDIFSPPIDPTVQLEIGAVIYPIRGGGVGLNIIFDSSAAFDVIHALARLMIGVWVKDW